MNDQPKSQPPTDNGTSCKNSGPCCPGVRIVKFLAVLAVMVGIGLVVWFARPNRSDDSADKLPQKTASASSDRKPDEETESPIDPAAEQRRLLVGVWEDDYKGKRVLTVRNDGTATMIVELSGLIALFAAKLQFEETWTIDDGHLTMKVTSGEPAARVNLILKTMGDSTRQRILELTESRLRLLDENGETEYDWRRIEPTPVVQPPVEQLPDSEDAK